MVLILKHLHRSHTNFLSPKSPGRRELCCAARPRRSPFSSEVCGDFPDGPRPLSSHQFSPLGDLPRWDFEVLTLGVVGVSESIRACGPHGPPRLESCNTGRGETGGEGASPAAFRVTCPSSRNRNLAVHTKATEPARDQRWLCARHVAPAAN